MALILLPRERSAEALTQPQEQSLDVFAGAQSVHGKIRTGAEILEQARAAHRDPVLSAAGGPHLVVAVSLSSRFGQDALDGRLGALLTGRNLFFNEHLQTS